MSSPSSQRFLFPYRPTIAGFVYVALTVFILIATLNSQSPLLFFTFGIAAGGLVASVVLSHFCLRGLSVERVCDQYFIAGESTAVLYRFTSRKRFWPCLAVHFREEHPDLPGSAGGFLLHLPAGATLSVTASLTPRRRGILRLSAIRLSTTFPFGFLRRIVRIRAPHECIVYPRIGMLNRRLALQYRESIESGTMTSQRRGGYDDFHGIREYRPGDSVRTVHWRSTARMGQLMIREMAASVPPRMTVVLNLRTRRDSDDADAAERAIELAAALIAYGFFENFAVGLAVAGVDTHTPPAPLTGRDARAQLLHRLALLSPDDIRPDAGILYPAQFTSRVEWIVVTLHADDGVEDLLGPAGAGSRSALAAGVRAGGHHTILALDAPDAKDWVRFLSSKETLRLFHQQGDESSGQSEKSSI